MEQKIYSIIIPHYNLPNLLRRLLTTIPRRDDLQVIVVDDCSTEDVDELNKLKQDFDWVEWYDTGTNGGGGKARNIGLEHAIGKYLIFADADDYFNLCFAEALDRYKDSDFDLILFAANSVDCDNYQSSFRGNTLSTIVNKAKDGDNIESIRYKVTSPWSKFISSELIKIHNIKFQESKVYNDMRFSQQVDYFSSKLGVDKTAIYCVTDRFGSVSSCGSPEKEIEKVKVMIDFYNFYHEKSIKFPLENLIGPTFFHLLTNNYPDYAKKALAEWKNGGISSYDIYKSLIIYKIKKMIAKIIKK